MMNKYSLNRPSEVNVVQSLMSRKGTKRCDAGSQCLARRDAQKEN